MEDQRAIEHDEMNDGRRTTNRTRRDGDARSLKIKRNLRDRQGKQEAGA